MQTRYEMMLDSVCRVWGLDRGLLELAVPLLLDAQLADAKAGDLDTVLDSLGAQAEAAENPPGQKDGPLLRWEIRDMPWPVGEIIGPAGDPPGLPGNFTMPDETPPKGPGKTQPRGDKKPEDVGKRSPVVPPAEAEALRVDVLAHLKTSKRSQKFLAEALYVSCQTINKLLRGDAPMRRHHADMLRGWLDNQRQTVAAPKTEDDAAEAVRHILGEDA